MEGNHDDFQTSSLDLCCLFIAIGLKWKRDSEVFTLVTILMKTDRIPFSMLGKLQINLPTKFYFDEI